MSTNNKKLFCIAILTFSLHLFIKFCPLKNLVYCYYKMCFNSNMKIWQNHLFPNPFHMVDAKFYLVLRPISHGNPAMSFTRIFLRDTFFVTKRFDFLQFNQRNENFRSVALKKNKCFYFLNYLFTYIMEVYNFLIISLLSIIVLIK